AGGGGSKRATGAGADDGRGAGGGGGVAEVLHAAADELRGGGAGAGVGGDLRRDLVQRHAAHGRDRGARGARRAAAGRGGAGGRPGDGNGGGGRGDRRAAGAVGREEPERAAVRGGAARSSGAGRGERVPAGRGIGGGAGAGAAGDADRPDDRDAGRIAFSAKSAHTLHEPRRRGGALRGPWCAQIVRRQIAYVGSDQLRHRILAGEPIADFTWPHSKLLSE